MLNSMDPILRPLSPIESFYVEIEISIQTTSHLEGHLDPETLRQALYKIAQRHPLLAARIIQKNGAYTFEKISEFHPSLTLFESGSYHTLARDELNRPLQVEKELFRAVLLHNKKKAILITTIHHAIGDGLSSIDLHRQILQACSDDTYGSPLPLIPSLETLLKPSMSSSELIDYAKRHAEFADSIQPQIFEPPEESSHQTLDFIQEKLNSEQLQSLNKQCKAHQTTIHGVICASHILAVREQFKGEQPIDLCCHSAVDIRSRLNPPIANEQMASLAWSWTSCNPVGHNTSLWDLSKKFSEDLQTSIRNQDVHKKTLSFGKITRKIPTAFYVTNVGNMEMRKEYNQFTLQEIDFIPACKIPMLVAAVGTFSGELYIHYPHLTPHYSSLIRKIATRAKQLLITS